MGRVLHVSRSFPPFITSARMVVSLEKLGCLPPCKESVLSNCNNGLPLCNRRFSSEKILPFAPGPPAQGSKTMLRTREDTIGAVLARRFSSATEASDSEWPETDGDHEHCSTSGQYRHSRQPLVRNHELTACETESETDNSSEEGNKIQRKAAPRSRCLAEQEKADCANYTEGTEVDTDLVSRFSNKNDHQSRWKRKSASLKFQEDSDSRYFSTKRDRLEQTAYATESETDEQNFSSDVDNMEDVHRVQRKSMHCEANLRKCVKRTQQIFDPFETDSDAATHAGTSKNNKVLDCKKWEYESISETGSETDNETDAKSHRQTKTDKDDYLHNRNQSSKLHRVPAKNKHAPEQYASDEMEAETDYDTEDNENDVLHGQKGKWHDFREDAASEGEDWLETDADELLEDGKGYPESEAEAYGSGSSDWEKTDEDESEKLWKDVYGFEEDTRSPRAGSRNLSGSADRSYPKASSRDDSHRSSRTAEKPSRKERSAGLSPRTMRDDDSDEIEIESDLEGELQEEIERQMAAEPKFRRPSITWGILLTRELRVEARENVLKYLEDEGIDTNPLRCIELPSKVEVMQTRLGFLRKIGLDNDAINKYPLILGCSVSKNMVPVLKYLKKLGFPQHWVPILLKKYPTILHASVVIDVLPVIYFLRGLDIDALDLARVIMRYPDLLAFKTEGTMSTSVAYLVSMGVNLRHVGYMLTEFPEILGMRVASVLKPKFEYLMSLGIPQMIVAKILTRRPHLLGYDLERRMRCNIDQLIELGVRKEAIPGMVAHFPEILGRVLTHSIKDQVDWLMENLELTSESVARIIEKMPQVIFLPTAMARERIRFLKSERFTDAEVGSMVARAPHILVSSIFDSLRPNLNFLTKEMKRSRAELLDFPAFLTYSLHARIRPRFQVLTGENTQCSLDWLLNCSDLEFQKRLKSGYKCNEGCINIEFVMGGTLPKKPALDESEIQANEVPKVAAL